MSERALREYRGYKGFVVYEDETLLIRIVSDDFVTTSLAIDDAARPAFETLVDDYLRTLADLG